MDQYEHYYSQFVLRGMARNQRGNDGLVRLDFGEASPGEYHGLHLSGEKAPFPVKKILGEMNLNTGRSTVEGAESLLATIERKASQALAGLRRRERVLVSDYFALSQYARLLFVRNPEWTLENGYQLFDSLVRQTPENGVIYSVLFHRHSHQGWFISRNRPLGMQGLFPMTTAWSGDYSGHSTDVLAYAPVERHEHMTMYAYPGQADSGFYMCETKVPVEMESVTAAFALMASTIEGKNTIYVNPGDADFYRVLIEQNLASVSFRERMLKLRAAWKMGKSTVETRYIREGDWFIPAATTRVKDSENAESLSQLRTLPYAPSFRGYYSGDSSLSPEEWHAYWEGYMELSRYIYAHRHDTNMVVIDLSHKHSSKIVMPHRSKPRY